MPPARLPALPAPRLSEVCRGRSSVSVLGYAGSHSLKNVHKNKHTHTHLARRLPAPARVHRIYSCVYSGAPSDPDYASQAARTESNSHEPTRAIRLGLHTHLRPQRTPTYTQQQKPGNARTFGGMRAGRRAPPGHRRALAVLHARKPV